MIKTILGHVDGTHWFNFHITFISTKFHITFLDLEFLTTCSINFYLQVLQTILEALNLLLWNWLLWYCLWFLQSKRCEKCSCQIVILGHLFSFSLKIGTFWLFIKLCWTEKFILLNWTLSQNTKLQDHSICRHATTYNISPLPPQAIYFSFIVSSFSCVMQNNCRWSWPEKVPLLCKWNCQYKRPNEKLGPYCKGYGFFVTQFQQQQVLYPRTL